MRKILWLLILIMVSVSVLADCKGLTTILNEDVSGNDFHGWAFSFPNADSFYAIYDQGNEEPICSDSPNSLGDDNYNYYYDDNRDCLLIYGADPYNKATQDTMRGLCNMDSNYIFLDVLDYGVEELYYVNDVKVGGSIAASHDNDWLQVEDHDKKDIDTYFRKLWRGNSKNYYLSNSYKLPLNFGCEKYYLVDSQYLTTENDPMIPDCGSGKLSITPNKGENEVCIEKGITDNDGRENNFWFKAEYKPQFGTGSDYRILTKYSVKFEDHTPKIGTMNFALVCYDPKSPDDVDSLCRDFVGNANAWLQSPKNGFSLDDNNRCCQEEDEGKMNGGYICNNGQWMDPSELCQSPKAFEGAFTSYGNFFTSMTGYDACCGDDNSEGKITSSNKCEGANQFDCSDFSYDGNHDDRYDKCSSISGCSISPSCEGKITCSKSDCFERKPGCEWDVVLSNNNPICSHDQVDYSGKYCRYSGSGQDKCVDISSSGCYSYSNDYGNYFSSYVHDDCYITNGDGSKCEIYEAKCVRTSTTCEDYSNDKDTCIQAGCTYSFDCSGDASCDQQNNEDACRALGCNWVEGTGDLGYVSSQDTGVKGQYLCLKSGGSWQWKDIKDQSINGFTILSQDDGDKNVDFISNYPDTTRNSGDSTCGRDVREEDLTWSKCDVNNLLTSYSVKDASDGNTIQGYENPPEDACDNSHYHKVYKSFMCFKENSMSSKILECSDGTNIINNNRARSYGDSLYSFAGYDDDNKKMITEFPGDSGKITITPQEKLEANDDDYLAFDVKVDEDKINDILTNGIKVTVKTTDDNEYMETSLKPLYATKDYMHFVMKLSNKEAPPCQSTCDNGIVECYEECDEGVNNGRECTPNYGLRCEYCNENCKWVTVIGPYCGDGKCQSDYEGTDHNPCEEDCGISV